MAQNRHDGIPREAASQDMKSPDDPVQDGVGSSGVVGGVSQRGVSSELSQATFIG